MVMMRSSVPNGSVLVSISMRACDSLRIRLMHSPRLPMIVPLNLLGMVTYNFHFLEDNLHINRPVLSLFALRQVLDSQLAVARRVRRAVVREAVALQLQIQHSLKNEN